MAVSSIAHPPLKLPSDRPSLLLDIDGVINVFQCSFARGAQLAPHLPTVKLLPGLEEWLARLDRAYYLIWCSESGALANIDAARAWGIGPRPLIEPARHQAALPDWKALAVERAFKSWPGAVAWVEDGFTPAARAWAAARLRQGRRTWLADVRETGLTAEITEQLVAWAEL
jgi:hypothetical protein